jgi:hypothetical protein
MEIYAAVHFIDLKVYEFFTQHHHPFDQQQRPFE